MKWAWEYLETVWSDLRAISCYFEYRLRTGILRKQEKEIIVLIFEKLQISVIS